MNFNDLMAKMRELDQPATETIQPTIDTPVEECGEPMGMTPPMGDAHKDTPPPSMSVNLNAQGLDDISELMKLMTKVNPDMINQKGAEEPGLPKLGIEPSITSIKPSMPPLKMLPDLDADNDDKAGGEHDIEIKGMSADKPEEDEAYDPEKMKDGDMHGAGAGDISKDDEEEKDEAFGNSLNGSEPEYKDISAAIPDGDDLNKSKKMVKHSYRQGDNPMAMEGNDLRAAIRAELLQRLAEADMGKHNNKTTGFKAVAKKAAKEYGSKEAGERVAGAVKAKMAKAGKL
jgi:hypothetical protein